MKEFTLFCRRHNITPNELLKCLRVKRNVTILFDPKQKSILLSNGKETILFEPGANGMVRMPVTLNGHWQNVLNSYNAA